MRVRTVLILLPAIVGCLWAAGCSQDDVTAYKEAAAVSADGALPDSLFAADIVLCSRVGSKTGRRFGVGDSFRIREGKKYRYVRAFVDLWNVPLDRDHQVHLVWIKPGGDEMFRRFGTLRCEAVDGGYRSTLTWLDAEDLHDVSVEEPVISDTPSFTLDSRLNIAPEKEREPGDYVFRFYWNRELMAEKGFELVAMEGDAGGEDDGGDED